MKPPGRQRSIRPGFSLFAFPLPVFYAPRVRFGGNSSGDPDEFLRERDGLATRCGWDSRGPEKKQIQPVKIPACYPAEG
jgi:hypothetical protein